MSPARLMKKVMMPKQMAIVSCGDMLEDLITGTDTGTGRGVIRLMTGGEDHWMETLG